MTFLRLFSSPRMVVFLLLTVLLLWVEVVIMHTAAFSRHPMALSFGILFDLVLAPTVVFYQFVARPLQLTRSQFVFMALLMLRVAWFVLPQTLRLPNQLWPFLLALSEGAVLLVAGFRIRTIGRTYRPLHRAAGAETALRGSLTAVFGEKVAGVMSGEFLVFYYVLLGWRLQSDLPIWAKALTTHRQSGQVALVAGLLLAGIIEGVGVHLLLTRWNPAIAFWVTLFSAYGMLFFVADMIAMVKRPSYLSDNELCIRLGVRWSAIVSRANISDVSLIYEKLPKQPGQLDGSFLTTPNVLLTFREPICFQGPYGIQKQVSRFAFFVDDRAAFVQQLTNAEWDKTRFTG